MLNHGGRGLNILTDAGDLWVLDHADVDPDLLGRRVTAEGIRFGCDRLKEEWMGEIASQLAMKGWDDCLVPAS